MTEQASADPDKDGGKVECGLVGDGELVRSHGQAAPLLETVDASFDSVALLVCLGIEVGRATSFTASPEMVADLISRSVSLDRVHLFGLRSGALTAPNGQRSDPQAPDPPA